MKTASFIPSYFAKLALCVATCFAASPGWAAPVPMTNAGFETSSVGQGFWAFTYFGGQTVDGWTYTGGSGISANNSAFEVYGASGNQAAFLQSAGAGISQTFNFTGGLLSVSFLAETRTRYGGNIINVLIDGQKLLFNGTEALLAPTEYAFTSYTSDAIALSTGEHVLSFLGTANGDVTTFIDDVTMRAVPEPGSLALLAIGAICGVTLRRRRRKA